MTVEYVSDSSNDKSIWESIDLFSMVILMDNWELTCIEHMLNEMQIYNFPISVWIYSPEKIKNKEAERNLLFALSELLEFISHFSRVEFIFTFIVAIISINVPFPNSERMCVCPLT